MSRCASAPVGVEDHRRGDGTDHDPLPVRGAVPRLFNRRLEPAPVSSYQQHGPVGSTGVRLSDPRGGAAVPQRARVAVGPAGGARAARACRLAWFPPVADIEPCVRFSRTRLPDVLHRGHSASRSPRPVGAWRDDGSVKADQPEPVRRLVDDYAREAPGAPAGRRSIVRSVLAALAVVIPLGLGGAVSPVMLTEQTVLLAGSDGGGAGERYAAGVVLTTFVIVAAIVLFGRAISLPTQPHLDATLDLVLGLVLVNVAVLVLVSGRRRGGSPSPEGGDDGGASGSRQARAAFAFGVFAMATNVTTLALIAPAAKEISRTDVEIAAEAVLVVVLVGLVSMPAWVPVALTKVAPIPSQRGLTAVRDQIARRGRGFTVGLLSAAGLFFLARGLIRLLG